MRCASTSAQLQLISARARAVLTEDRHMRGLRYHAGWERSWWRSTRGDRWEAVAILPSPPRSSARWVHADIERNTIVVQTRSMLATRADRRFPEVAPSSRLAVRRDLSTGCARAHLCRAGRGSKVGEAGSGARASRSAVAGGAADAMTVARVPDFCAVQCRGAINALIGDTAYRRSPRSRSTPC